ncbi:MAG: hypothetical protein GX801_01560 [Fibrobacter sp.]|nr:hypothetical protein [Fibrobacter sp.]
MLWGLKQRLGGFPRSSGCLWLHGASLGECNALLQLYPALATLGRPIVLTTQKAEIVAELRRRAPSKIRVALAPAPFKMIARHWLRQVQPQMLILYEGEIWPAWLQVLQAQGVPVALVSARMSDQAWTRYGLQHKYWRAQLQGISAIWAQSANHAHRWAHFYSGPIAIGGDWKLWHKTMALPQSAGNVDLVAISVHRADWKLMGEGLLKHAEMGGKTVVIPRHPSDAPWFAQKIRRAQQKSVPWPQVEAGAISLVHQFGQVGAVLKEANIAVMGGSFGGGGIHDFWEPLFAGVPVISGLQQGHHSEVLRALQAAGAVGVVDDLANMRIGNHGRDVWLENWFPWEKRYEIPRILQEYLQPVQQSVPEFVRWVGERIRA